MTDILTVTLNPALDVSATTAHVQPTRKLRCAEVQRHPGGGGINVARVLHRLGADCAALFPLGGSTGVLLAQLLEDEGVPSLTVPIAGHIRESFTVRDAGSGQEFRFVLPGPELAVQEWQACLNRVEALHPAPMFLVGSGSLPPGAPDDFYARLGAVARARGSRLVVDTSGAALALALQGGVYMVKPSLGEMRELTGLPLTTLADVADAARQWVQAGQAEVVVVSLGEKGALMATSEGVQYAPALALQVVSAVGAGDSFVAGMVWALARQTPIADAFRFGVACGSAALASTGTGLCAADDSHRLLPQVLCQSETPASAL